MLFRSGALVGMGISAIGLVGGNVGFGRNSSIGATKGLVGSATGMIGGMKRLEGSVTGLIGALIGF